MRIVVLDESSFTPGSVTDEGTLLTGKDESTSELVSFVVKDTELVRIQHGLEVTTGVVYMTVADFQVVDVEPTSGEWDSPGTSPEEGA